MSGQLSDQAFMSQHPAAHYYVVDTTLYATTRYGLYTTNYWIRHTDYSWTNYNCKSN